MDIAREQYCSCPDIIDQSTIEQFAAALMANRHRIFWWD
ncbi:DUF4253 domain-containing protein [Nocardia sp. NBC_01009]|nr:DUF4253 domain-containing protein [Nocardia sp. NBC_01009]